MDSAGKAEHFFEQTAGCGPFQLVVLFVVVAPCLSTFSYSILFMSFGNYNPGWRCLDNVTTPNISSSPIDSIDVAYTTGSCDDYNQCQQVKFDPETSTIVTEWGLLCDKSWMSSMTISVQMAGMLICSFFVGQLADLIGRKKTLYAGIALSGIMQLISAFSVSWIMFTVFLFFSTGISVASYLIVMIYASEVVTMKWRALVITFPFWYTGAIVQAVTTLITKDWRYVQIIGFILHVLCFIPVFWVPESLRWLEANRMSQKFDPVSQKIARLNKVDHFPTLDNENILNNSNESKVMSNGVVKKYTIIDIFRHGYALISICVGVLTFIFSFIFYSMTFGTKSLYGNFYINLIAMNVIAFVIFLLALVGIKYTSRKLFTFFMLAASAVCIFVATGLLYTDSEAVKSIGSTLLISVARATIDSTWFCVYSRITEIYPTVVRGIGLGYASITARVGGIVAPLIIPEDSDNLHYFTITAGVSVLVGCILSCILPETKGKPLKDDFEKRVAVVDETLGNDELI